MKLDNRKGVIVSVVPDEEMPVDENGNRVELIMDDLSTTRRLNPARFYEQYINAASRDIVKRINKRLGFDPSTMSKAMIRDFFSAEHRIPKLWEEFNYLLGYYQIVSPHMYQIMSEEFTESDVIRHMISVCTEGIYLYFPTNNPVDRPDMIRQIHKHYPPFITPVTFTNMAGEKVTTKAPVLIGSMYFMVLEKTAEDWSAVSSAKRSHYGTTARLTNYDKYSAPGRQQPTKTIGESEARLLAAAVGGDPTADLMDISNNPLAHKAMQRAVLTADRPTDIPVALDRKEIPKGGHRPLSFVKHLFECSGKTFSND